MEPVFVSYCSQNLEAVESLAEDIKALGHKVWLDRELAGGHIWWDQILASIRDCGIVVFAVSPQSLDSRACQLECTYAVELGKPVLPIVIAEGASSGLLPAALTQIQTLDYRQRDRRSAFALARAFGQVPAPAPLPDPLPAPPDRPVSAIDSVKADIVSPETLKFEDQTAILVRLKEFLRDPIHAADARQLIEKLRRRDDLYAKVAAQIDSALERLTGINAAAATPEPAVAAAKAASMPVRPAARPKPAKLAKPVKTRRTIGQRLRRFALSIIVLWCVGFVVAVVQATMRF